MRSLCLLVLISLAAPHGRAFAQNQEVARVLTDVKPQTLIRVSKETTYYTSPLTPDGYVDYLEALNLEMSQGVTPQNNLEVVLRELLGSKSIEEPNREEYFRRLGIPLPAKEDGSFIDPFRFEHGKEMTGEARQDLLDRYTSRTETPWVKAEDQFFARWVAANDAALNRLNEASKRPHFYAPYLADGDERSTLQSVISVLLPSVQEVRDLARALSIRAMLRIGEGDLDGAWEDLQTIHRLGEHVGGGLTLIESLVGIAVRSVAYAGQQKLAQSGKLTSDQAQRFLNDLNASLSQFRIAESIDRGERIFGLSVVQELAWSTTNGTDKASQLFGGDELGTIVTQLLRNRGAAWVDWNVILEMFNGHYDRFVELGRETDPTKRKQLSAAIAAQFEELNERARSPIKSGLKALFGGPEARGRQLGDILCALLLPAIEQAYAAQWRVTATADVTRLGFAIESYRLAHRKYPASLEELADRFGGKLPLDPFAQASYRYVQKDSGFDVYSVGVNQRDDGGRTYGEQDGSNTVADDVRFRIRRP